MTRGSSSCQEATFNPKKGRPLHWEFELNHATAARAENVTWSEGRKTVEAQYTPKCTTPKVFVPVPGNSAVRDLESSRRQTY